MWLIKTELQLFNSIRRYLRYNKGFESNQIFDDYNKDCKVIIYQCEEKPLDFFIFLNKLPHQFDIDTFWIIGEKSIIINKLNIFLKDNNQVKLVDYFELFKELTEIKAIK